MRLIRHTRRLTIRPLRLSDYAAWAASWRRCTPKRNEWDRGQLAEQKLTRKAFRAMLTRFDRAVAKDTIHQLAMFNRRTGEFVGSVDLMVLVRLQLQWANLGYRVQNHLWGRGYAREGVRAAIDIAFKDLGLHRVEAGIELGNRPSIAVARALGLRREGIRRSFLYAGSPPRWLDLVIFAATGPAQQKPRVGLKRR